MSTSPSAYRHYDPFAPEVMTNPLPFYAELRDSNPALYLGRYDTWVFSRFQDIFDVLTVGGNTFIGSETTLPTPEILLRHNNGFAAELPIDPIPNGAMTGSPHFEVLRNAHIKPFRPSYVRSLAELVERLANERLDELLPQKHFDLTQDYGGIVAASVVCHLLAMPLSRAGEVLELVNSLSQTDPEKGGTDVATTVGRCVDILVEYVASRRKAWADGAVPLIDGLINLQYYGRPLSDVEVATQLVCSFIGGTETVPKITAHGLMELNDRPEQMRAVKADLDKNALIAVEEMIRFCAPAQWFARTAHQDIQIAGANIRKGQRVIVLFGSAARDEREYDRPNDFIWDRKITRVLSFGTGQHYCIGIHLARLELRTMVATFLRRVERFSVDRDEAVRLPSSFQWGWNRLPVTIDRGR